MRHKTFVFLATIAASVIAIGACSGPPGRHVAPAQSGSGRLIVILIDNSGSTVGERRTGLYTKIVTELATGLEPGDRIVAGVINDHSHLFEPIVHETLPHVSENSSFFSISYWSGSGPMAEEVKRKHEAAELEAEKAQIAQALAAAAGSKDKAPNTCICAAIEVVATQYLLTWSGQKFVVILSDGIEDCQGLVLGPGIPTQRLTLGLRSRLPDLHGVIAYFAGLSTSSPSRFRTNQQIWQSVLADSGADVCQQHMGYDPPLRELRSCK